MPKPVQMLLYCIVLIAAVDSGVERQRLGWVQPWSLWYDYSHIRFARNDGDPRKIVAIGSSHINHGIIARLAENRLRSFGLAAPVYNVAANGSALANALPIVRDGLLTKNPPRLILLGVSTYDFRSDRADARFRRDLVGPQDCQWLLRVPWNLSILDAVAQGCLRGPKTLVQLPLLLDRQLAEGTEEMRETGGGVWARNDEDAGRRSNARYLKKLGGGPGASGAVAPERKDPYLLDPSLSHFRRAESALVALIRATRSKGVDLVVLSDPLPAEALGAGSRTRAGYNVVTQHVSAICSRYNVPFWDVNRPTSPFTQRDFFDGAHLGPDAAARYTALVVDHAVLPVSGSVLASRRLRPPLRRQDAGNANE